MADTNKEEHPVPAETARPQLARELLEKAGAATAASEPRAWLVVWADDVTAVAAGVQWQECPNMAPYEVVGLLAHVRACLYP